MIFDNSLSEGILGLNIRDSQNGSLTADSQSLQAATLKILETKVQCLREISIKTGNLTKYRIKWTSLCISDMR